MAAKYIDIGDCSCALLMCIIMIKSHMLVCRTNYRTLYSLNYFENHIYI